MSTTDHDLSNIQAEIGREIIRLVPHWYQADCGPAEYYIPVGDNRTRFFNHRRLTPSLKTFLTKISARTRDLALSYFVQFPGLIDVLLENLAVEWLRMHSATTDWVKLLRYLETIARRTNENLPVSLNLIVRPGPGKGDITQPHLQKFFDRLASSPYSYLMVDPELRLIEYGEVGHAQVREATAYKFHPEFLHPIHSVMENGDVSAHLTTHGDIVIVNRAGLLAARRKRKWRVYDVRTFKNGLASCLGNYHVGANLFEVVFDLSFRRQGSLLIYDPRHQIRERLLNAESAIYDRWRNNGKADERDSGQALIGPSIERIAIGKEAGALKRKRRLIEMACVDGAVLFDDERLLAVGALVRSHPSVGSQLGARKTAARSAYLWGAHPIEVSSDGDVTLYFKSHSATAECDAVMSFL